MTLREIQNAHRVWALKNFGERPSWHPLLGAVEELGELAHAHLKEQQGIRRTEDHVANAKDAVADVVLYLMDYCSLRDFDMQEVVESTWYKVRQRDWKANPDTAHVGLGDLDKSSSCMVKCHLCGTYTPHSESMSMNSSSGGTSNRWADHLMCCKDEQACVRRRKDKVGD